MKMLRLFATVAGIAGLFFPGSALLARSVSAPPGPLWSLCSLISERNPETRTDVFNQYVYQTRIQEASGVTASDSEEEARRKIQQEWSRNIIHYQCTAPGFMEAGSMIKFAVYESFDTFVEDVVQWGVDLNHVDDHDGQTVLDYVRHALNRERARGSSLVERLSRYHRLLRSGGAKHCDELIAEGSHRQRDCGVAATDWGYGSSVSGACCVP